MGEILREDKLKEGQIVGIQLSSKGESEIRLAKVIQVKYHHPFFESLEGKRKVVVGMNTKGESRIQYTFPELAPVLNPPTEQVETVEEEIVKDTLFTRAKRAASKFFRNFFS